MAQDNLWEFCDFVGHYKEDCVVEGRVDHGFKEIKKKKRGESILFAGQPGEIVKVLEIAIFRGPRVGEVREPSSPR